MHLSALLGASSSLDTSRQTLVSKLDAWLCNGLVVDGTGTAPYLGHVGIHGDTIEVIKRDDFIDEPSVAEVVDCTGHVVAPGFIDIHTHSDLSFLHDPDADSKLMQGVTTEVTGNCGFSPYPVNDRHRHSLEEFLRSLGTPLVDVTWNDFAGYVAALEACRPVMNVAPLVGHGAMRIAAAGSREVAITDELVRDLVVMLRDCLDQGVFGISTGLTYVPSKFASSKEISTLVSVLLDYDALYTTHAKATADPFEAFDDAISIGRHTGARVQFSHIALNDPAMWGRADEVLAQFDEAFNDGVDIRYDVYPYEASASALTQYLPDWAQARGGEGLADLLRDRHSFELARADLARGLYGTIRWDWERVIISLAGPGDEQFEGSSVAAAADQCNTSAEEFCLQLCMRHGNLVQVLVFYRDERDVAEFLRHRLGTIGSDGNSLTVAAAGRPHPRSFGSHARLLQRFVVEDEQLSLVEAVHKATFVPARQLRLADRGRVIAGTRADVIVLDLTSVRETATWSEPCQLAEGVRDVWINGQRAVKNGTATGRRAGRVLKHGS